MLRMCITSWHLMGRNRGITREASNPAYLGCKFFRDQVNEPRMLKRYGVKGGDPN